MTHKLHFDPDERVHTCVWNRCPKKGQVFHEKKEANKHQDLHDLLSKEGDSNVLFCPNDGCGKWGYADSSGFHDMDFHTHEHCRKPRSNIPNKDFVWKSPASEGGDAEHEAPEHFKEHLFHCDVKDCPKPEGFLNEHDLLEHRKFHENNGRNISNGRSQVCCKYPYCPYFTFRSDSLNAHMDQCQMNPEALAGKLKCAHNDCPKKGDHYRSTKLLNKHLQWHEEDVKKANPFLCPRRSCPGFFPKFEKAMQHLAKRDCRSKPPNYDKEGFEPNCVLPKVFIQEVVSSDGVILTHGKVYNIYCDYPECFCYGLPFTSKGKTEHMNAYRGYHREIEEYRQTKKM